MLPGEDNRKKNSIYSQVSERVSQAMKQFQKMEDIEKALDGQQTKLDQAKQNTGSMQEQRKQLTAQIAEWKKHGRGETWMHRYSLHTGKVSRKVWSV